MRIRTLLVGALVCGALIQAQASSFQVSAFNPSSDSYDFASNRQQAKATATLSSRVVDAGTGEPVAKVKILVTGSQQTTVTDDNGVFILHDLQPGQVELSITAVGYGVVKKTFTLSAGETTEKDIAINQEGATLTEQITVTTDPYEKTETNAASEYDLSKSELQTISMVLLGDPLRASQFLPGVTANNDLRSDFAIRGAGFPRLGIFIDGILTDGFIHKLTEGETTDEVSLSVINQDTISGVSLFSGAFPAKYGGRSAAMLLLDTREGNRVRTSGRFATGVLTTSGVVDGSLARGQGSWLLAARTSYVDYLQRLIERVTGTGSSQTNQDEESNLNFGDMQGKVVRDLSARHQLGITAIFGIFLGDQGEANRAQNMLDANVIDASHSDNLFLTAHWNFTTGARLLAQTRWFALQSGLHSKNIDDLPLDDEERRQFGMRHDLSFLAPHNQHIETGFYVRRVNAEKLTNFFQTSIRALESYDRRATGLDYYVQDTWNSERHRLSVTGGGRIEYSGLIGETLFAPRAAMTLAPGDNWMIRAGLGRYSQSPDFDHLFGFFGNPNLSAERATHYNLSVERALGNKTRVVAEAYDREDRDQLFSLSELRIEGGQVTARPSPYQNSLRGYARGVEFSVQRRSANGLTGWLSYAYSRTRLTDEQSGLSFVSDFDQRHTLNLYGSYRFTSTFNLSGGWRYGSGLPWIGFLQKEGDVVSLGSQRNQVRVPDYSRVDLRASKAFLFQKWKLTLSGEILNLLNHKNLYNVESNLVRFQATGRFRSGLRESFHVLPSVGVAIEF